MLWIIGSSGEKQMSKEIDADVDHLGGNSALAGQLARVVYEYTLEQVTSVLAPAVGAGEAIYVLTHASYEERPGLGRQPWIGGLWMDEFAGDMVTRFTAAGLSGRNLWFLLCFIGTDVMNFATKLSTRGVRNTTIYMPTDFMYISTNGIPHLLPNCVDEKEADQAVVKGGCDFMWIAGSLGTGKGWAGARIDADGAVTRLGTIDVEAAVIERFDPEESED